jgi:hypothetical protein
MMDMFVKRMNTFVNVTNLGCHLRDEADEVKFFSVRKHVDFAIFT